METPITIIDVATNFVATEEAVVISPSAPFQIRPMIKL